MRIHTLAIGAVIIAALAINPYSAARQQKQPATKPPVSKPPVTKAPVAKPPVSKVTPKAPAAKAAAVVPKLAGPTLVAAAQLEAAARRCDTAEQALLLYQLFLADTRVAAAERDKARPNLDAWKQRAEPKLVRVGAKWVPLEERNRLRDEIDAAVQAAFDLISRVTFQDVVGGSPKVKENLIAAEKKIEEAKQKAPDGFYEEFLLGFLSAAYAHDATMAQKRFAECLKHDPDHVSVLNNLALSNVRLKRYPEAVRLWKAALAIAPGSPEIGQNVARLFRHFEAGRVKLTKIVATQLEQLSANLETFGAAKYDPKSGWLYMAYYESPLKTAAQIATPKPEKPADPTASAIAAATARPRMMVGAGAGVVIHPKYIVTNRHLVQNADGVSIATAGGTSRLPAEIVAVSDTLDLALLKCDGLTAPAARLAAEFPKDGANITLAGFPNTDRLGAAPQATKGTILTAPSADTAQLSILNAELFPNTTGGPVLDSSGALVGVLSSPAYGELSNYSCAVPIAPVREFVRGKLKDFVQASQAVPAASGSDASDSLQHSTVLVFVEKYPKPAPLAGAQAGGGSTGGVLFIDPWCTACDGRPSPKCTNRKCKAGKVVVVEEKLQSDSFKAKKIKVRYEKPCDVCSGYGVLRCVRCLGRGLDPDVIGH
jgi:S1-C subfamily serine protease